MNANMVKVHTMANPNNLVFFYSKLEDFNPDYVIECLLYFSGLTGRIKGKKLSTIFFSFPSSLKK